MFLSIFVILTLVKKRLNQHENLLFKISYMVFVKARFIKLKHRLFGFHNNTITVAPHYIAMSLPYKKKKNLKCTFSIILYL